jgi:tellurite resistance protein TehA-like permease
MSDLLARIGLLLVIIILSFPTEPTDMWSDGLGLFLLAFGILLFVFIVAELLDVDLVATRSSD